MPSPGSQALQLPRFIQQRLERRAQPFLTPTRGAPMAFDAPAGELSLVGPDSMSWRVFKSPLSLFIGGVAAVLLELAEPRVRAGVWGHTSFRERPLERIQRTGFAAMVTVYGTRSQAEAMIAGVNQLHAKVQGQSPEGQAYSARDPELLDWVQATANYGFISAYSAFLRPVTPAELDAYYAEGLASAALYGATGAPRSAAEVAALFERMAPRLEASPIVLEFLDIMLRVPALPRAARPLQRMLLKAAVGTLPDTVRDLLQLGPVWSLQSHERWLVTHAVRLADRVLLSASPAVQACRRLGLPDDHLYRRR